MKQKGRLSTKEPNVQSALYDVLQHFNMTMEQAGNALLRLVNAGSTRDCGPHCSPPGTRETHCSCRMCHGKPVR